MDVGTYPAGSDVLNQEELGGESTVMMKVLFQTFSFAIRAHENRRLEDIERLISQLLSFQTNFIEFLYKIFSII